MYEIEMIAIDAVGERKARKPLLPGAIPGATVSLHTLAPGEELTREPAGERAFIFLSIDGKFTFAAGGENRAVSGRYVFIPSGSQRAQFRAESPTRLLEIVWEIPPNSREEWRDTRFPFPYVQEYFSAAQYRDRNKSDKTISRELVRQRIVPGFCMGSVESYGYDKVAQHPHPMLDQFFFSFPENEVEVLIDDFRIPMGGDTLLHIPLGSNHGVEVREGRHMHYIWIDFFLGQEGLDRLDGSHKHTGEQRSFHP